jgi:hypothetical protein
MLERVGMLEPVGGVFLALLFRDLEIGLTEDEKNWYAGWKTLGIWSQNGNYGLPEQQIFARLLAVGQRKASGFLTDKGDVWDIATDALAIIIGRCARARARQIAEAVVAVRKKK